VPTLRLLSVDARRFGRDRAALARAIATAGPDVACVHAGPHLLRWRSITASIARRSGLVVVGGGRTAAANVVLSSLAVDVLAVRDVRLRGGSGLRAPGAAIAALRLRGSEFVVASATLLGNAAERVAQAGEVQAAIRDVLPADLPSVVFADGVDRPGTAAWHALVDHRVGVGGRVFVDARFDVGEVSESDGAGPGLGAVVVELRVGTDRPTPPAPRRPGG
jgi:endonuclease/exonuclease/phosphatase family metal-dependent hydrolase